MLPINTNFPVVMDPKSPSVFPYAIPKITQANVPAHHPSMTSPFFSSSTTPITLPPFIASALPVAVPKFSLPEIKPAFTNSFGSGIPLNSHLEAEKQIILQFNNPLIVHTEQPDTTDYHEIKSESIEKPEKKLIDIPSEKANSEILVQNSSDVESSVVEIKHEAETIIPLSSNNTATSSNYEDMCVSNSPQNSPLTIIKPELSNQSHSDSSSDTVDIYERFTPPIPATRKKRSRVSGSPVNYNTDDNEDQLLQPARKKVKRFLPEPQNDVSIDLNLGRNEKLKTYSDAILLWKQKYDQIMTGSNNSDELSGNQETRIDANLDSDISDKYPSKATLELTQIHLPDIESFLALNMNISRLPEEISPSSMTAACSELTLFCSLKESELHQLLSYTTTSDITQETSGSSYSKILLGRTILECGALATSITFKLDAENKSLQLLTDENIQSGLDFIWCILNGFLRPALEYSSSSGSYGATASSLLNISLLSPDNPEDDEPGDFKEAYPSLAKNSPFASKKSTKRSNSVNIDSAYRTPTKSARVKNKKSLTIANKLDNNNNENESKEKEILLKTLCTNLQRSVYEILDSISYLLESNTDFPEYLLHRIISISMQIVFCEHFSSIQIPAIRVLNFMFTNFALVRESIVQDIFSSILTHGKGSCSLLTPYIVGSNYYLHIISVLSMSLVQCCASLPTSDTLSSSNINTSFENLNDLNSHSNFNSVSSSTQWVKTIVKTFIDQVTSATDTNNFTTYFQVFAQFSEDILMAMFSPEWPSAELHLKEIIIVLHRTINTPKVSDIHRKSALSLMGNIGAKLAEYRHSLQLDSILTKPEKWVPANEEEFSKAACPLCFKTFQGKKMISCNYCARWFHSDCCRISSIDIGIAIDSAEDSEWYCDACLLSYVKEMVNQSMSEFNQKPISAKESSQSANTSSTSINALDKCAFISCRMLLLNYLTNALRNNQLPSNDAKQYLLSNWYLDNETDDQLRQFYRLHFKLRNDEYLPSIWFNSVSDLDLLTSQIKDETTQSDLKTSSNENPYLNYCLSLVRPIKKSKANKEDQDYSHFMNFASRQTTLEDDPIWLGISPTPWGASRLMMLISKYSTKSAQSIFGFFQLILKDVIQMCDDEGSKIRAVAIKSLTNMLDADPSLFTDKSMISLLETRFHDPSPLAREKALELVGRFLLSRPDMTMSYIDIVDASISDDSTSVKKRVIKLILSLCILQPQSDLVVHFGSRLAHRTNSNLDAVSIQIFQAFKKIWFSDRATKAALLNEVRQEILGGGSNTSPTKSGDSSIFSDTLTTSQRLFPLDKSQLSEIDMSLVVDQILHVMMESRLDAEKGCPWFQTFFSFLLGKPIITSEAKNSIATSEPITNSLINDFVSHLVSVIDSTHTSEEVKSEIVDDVQDKNGNLNDTQNKNPSKSSLDQGLLKKKYFACLALNHISAIDPTILNPLIEVLRLYMTVNANSNSPILHVIEKKSLEIVTQIVDRMLPTLVPKPSSEFWSLLLRDLQKMIFSQGTPLISISVKCASTVCHMTQDDKWIKSLFVSMLNQLSGKPNNNSSNVSTQTPTSNDHHIIRYMFTVGQIIKYYPEIDFANPGDVEHRKKLALKINSIDSLKDFEYGKYVETVYKIILQFWAQSRSKEIKSAVLLTLGHLAPGSPGLLIRPSTEAILAYSLSNASPDSLKIQAIRTIYDFLTEEDSRLLSQANSNSNNSKMKKTKSRTTKGIKKSNNNNNTNSSDNLQSVMEIQEFSNSDQNNNDSFEEVEDDESSQENNYGDSSLHSQVNLDSGLSGAIIEIYIRRVLSLGLDKNLSIRQSALNLIENVVRMALVLPITCVPTLIALSTDTQLCETALRIVDALSLENIMSRLSEGIKTSYTFMSKSLGHVLAILRNEQHQKSQSIFAPLYHRFTAGTGKLKYPFLAAIVRMFDLSRVNSTTSGNLDILYYTYITTLLSQLPFTSLEEPLFIIYHINLLNSNQATVSLQVLETHYQGLNNNEESKNKQSLSSKDVVPPLVPMFTALVSWHLLILKIFLKSFYNITEEKIMSYLPSDKLKRTPCNVNVENTTMLEYLHQKDGNFNSFEVHPDWSRQPQVCYEYYQRFKSLLSNDDSDMDYTSLTALGNSSSHTPSKPKRTQKRNTKATHTSTTPKKGKPTDSDSDFNPEN